MITIKTITKSDYETVLEMMKVFYSSDAVFTNGSEEIFKCDIEACLSNNPFLEGYIFCQDTEIIGYGMLAKSFSTEFGKPCIWIEDLYIKPDYRGLGIGKQFMEFVEKKYPECLLRLEVEEENQKAVKLYKKCGFETLPYMEMKKILD